ncbi:MAG: YncE family protein [Candidatus Scalindua sp.]
MSYRFLIVPAVLGFLCLFVLIADLALTFVLVKNRWFFTESWSSYLLGMMDTITLWTGRIFWTIVVILVIARGILKGKPSRLPSTDRIIEVFVNVLRSLLPPRLVFSVPTFIVLLIVVFMLIKFLPSHFPYVPPASAILVTEDEKEIYAVDEVAGKIVIIERKPVGGGGLKTKMEVDLNRSGVQVRPQRLAISPDGKFVYITNPSADEIIIIDRGHNNTVLEPRSVGRLPRSIAFTPDGTKAYVSNEGPIPQGSISVIRVIDEKKNHVHQVIRNKAITGVNCPEGIAIPYNGRKLYVASQCGINEDPVFVIDTVTDKVLKHETIGKMQVGVNVALSPQHQKLYVARGNYPWRDNIKRRVGSPFSIVDTLTRKVLRTHTLQTSVNLVVVTPDEQYVLVGNGNNITVFDTKTDSELKTFTPREASPLGIAVSKDNAVYVLYPGMEVFTFGLSGLLPIKR